MKCKKCGYEWQAYGTSLSCPSCAASVALTASEQQMLWEEARDAERLKDHALRADCFLRLAEQGDRKAAYMYAECLWSGVGVEENREEALLWYKAAAAKMHPAAAYRLAVSLKNGRFGNNESQVFFWMRVAAEFGDADAALALYSMYEEGYGTAVSHRHALYYLTKSAKSEHPEAIALLAKMYAQGDGVARNEGAARFLLEALPRLSLGQKLLLRKLSRVEPSEPADIDLATAREERFALGKRAAACAEHAIAANIYFIAAREGDAEAAYTLGLCFEKGDGVPKSAKEARRRFEIAAEGGYAEAYLRLGDYEKDGVLGEKNGALALSYYQKAAAAGSAEGAFRTGEAYRFGTLAEADLAKALDYYSRAAALGHEEAKEREREIRDAVTVVYERALALYRAGSDENAYKQFTMAADMGHAAACCYLGILYEEGRGCKRDSHLAVHYYRLAAEQGNVEAIYRLGIAYAEGMGVGRDFKAAESFFGITAKQNYKESAAYLARIKRTRSKKMGKKAYSIATVLYRRGEVAEAIRFRSIAAKLGCARAMYVLGCHFEFGDGVPMDRERAAAWYRQAASAGFTPAAGNDLKGGILRERKLLLLRKKNS